MAAVEHQYIKAINVPSIHFYHPQQTHTAYSDVTLLTVMGVLVQNSLHKTTPTVYQIK